MPFLDDDPVAALIVPEVIRPAQFGQLYGSGSVILRTGSARLALAVLTCAVADVRRFRGASRPRHKRLFREACAWIASEDRAWPYSFVSICDALGLPVEAMRSALLGACPSFSDAA